MTLRTPAGTNSLAGITLGEWIRHYHQDWNINDPTPEDIAWGIIDVTRWPASPELIMWLTKHIANLENKIGKSDLESD
jgi:hypothetical protein